MKFVFAKKYLSEKNITIAFRVFLPRGKYVLCMAAANVYRIFLNGKFLGYGPMRTAHGYALIHKKEFTASSEENFIVVEVAAYNVNSYYTVLQQPFFGAEIFNEEGERVCDTDAFQGFLCSDRVQKINKYSMQRTFAEAYEMPESRTHFYCGGKGAAYLRVSLCEVKGCKLLDSDLCEPNYAPVSPVGIVESGKVFRKNPERYYDDVWFYKGNRWQTDGFYKEELSLDLLREIQELSFADKDEGEGTYQEYVFPCNKTGFLSLHVKAKGDAAVYLLFDELHPIVPWRLCAINAVKFALKTGEYDLLTFEPYTMQYCKVVVIGDAITENITLLTYENPEVLPFPKLPDKDAERIFTAAKETFAQNAVDVLTDCPSRERGGWLCDSYFTAQAEYLLTGKNRVERNLLRSYLLAPDPVSNLPKGMLPQCYPADHFDGCYIANWAFWLVLELKDYFIRTGDREFVQDFRAKIKNLFEFVYRFENEDELLENVDGWVFVEWSRANDFVQDVNYPSNMLYSAALQAAGELYCVREWKNKAERIRNAVRSKSFGGTFFADNAVRQNGKLVVTGNTSETCQYYAFFFGIASREKYPELYRVLFEEDSSELEKNYPQLHPSNAFIGNVLRLFILAREGNNERLFYEIKRKYLYMAERTGTLWEDKTSNASCCHGFASSIAVLLHGIHFDIQSQSMKLKLNTDGA